MIKSLENERLPQKLLGRDIIFFDGQCMLCHRMVKFVLSIDKDRHFLLCAQQSEMGHLVLERHGINVDDLSTIYLVTNCGTEGEQLLTRSKAAFFILSQTRGWGPVGKLLLLFPRPIMDFAYKIVASSRYQVFGKTDACILPRPEDQERIIG